VSEERRRGTPLRLLRRVGSRLEAVINRLERDYTPIGRFTPGPFEGWGFLWQPALLGFVALIAIFVGGSMVVSPFKLMMAHTWYFGVPAPSTADVPMIDENALMLSITLVYSGLVLLMRVWLRLAEVVKLHRGVPEKILWRILALWSLPMLIAPPLFSRDVFSYAAQGEMTSLHLSPYILGPFSLGANAFVNPVDPLWGNTPAPYGPFFLWLDSLVVRLTHHNELLSVVGLRLVEVAAVALLGWGLSRLAKTLGRDGGEAFVLGALNPLVILTLIGGIHNDALMAALLVAGVVFALRQRPVIGVILCSAAAAVKAPAALGIVYIAWTWRPHVSVRAKVRPLLQSAAIAGAVLLVFTFLAGFGFGWVKNLATPGTVRSWAAPATGLGMALTSLAHAVGLSVAQASVLSVTRLLGLLVAVGFSAYFLWHAEQRGWVRSLGLSLLLFVVLGPVVQPWYLVWGIVVLAAAYQGREHFWLLALSIASPFLGLPGAWDLWHGLLKANLGEMALASGILLGCMLVPLGHWTQWSWPGPEPSLASL
jgi:alpha-1,6-mannosyltransferase